MTDKSLAALRVAVLKALFDRWAILDRDLRDGLMQSTVPGERLPAMLPGTSEPVAWVTRTKPAKAKAAPAVVDPTAFLAWVRETRPNEVVQPPAPAEHVRTSYVTAVLAEVTAGTAYDTDTGLPPGVEWLQREPAKSNLRVVMEDGGAEAIEAAWASGALTLDELPAGSDG